MCQCGVMWIMWFIKDQTSPAAFSWDVQSTRSQSLGREVSGSEATPMRRPYTAILTQSIGGAQPSSHPCWRWEQSDLDASGASSPNGSGDASENKESTAPFSNLQSTEFANYNKWLFPEAIKFKEVTYTSLGDRNIPQISKLMPFSTARHVPHPRLRVHIYCLI